MVVDSWRIFRRNPAEQKFLSVSYISFHLLEHFWRLPMGAWTFELRKRTPWKTFVNSSSFFLILFRPWSGTSSRCRGPSRTQSWPTPPPRGRSTRSSGGPRSPTGSPFATTRTWRSSGSKTRTRRTRTIRFWTRYRHLPQQEPGDPQGLKRTIRFWTWYRHLPQQESGDSQGLEKQEEQPFFDLVFVSDKHYLPLPCRLVMPWVFLFLLKVELCPNLLIPLGAVSCNCVPTTYESSRSGKGGQNAHCMYVEAVTLPPTFWARFSLDFFE